MKYFLIVLFLSLPILTIAQEISSIKEAIKGLQAYYQSSDALGFELDYLLYAGHHSDVLHSSERGMYMKEGDRMYSKMGNIESLVEAKFIIGLDHTEKRLFIADNLSQSTPTISSQILEGLEAVQDQIQVTNLANGLAKMRINTQNAEMEAYEIIYEQANYQMKQLVIFYNRQIALDEKDALEDFVKTRLEINYSPISKLASFEEIMHREHYVSFSNGDPVASAKFRDYSIINSLMDR